MKDKLLHENISKAVLSNIGLAVFSFSVQVSYGYWRQLCTVGITAVTEERGKDRFAAEPADGTKPVP